MTGFRKEDFEKAGRPWDSQLKHRIAQILVYFRSNYEEMDADDKSSFAQWVSQLARLDGQRPGREPVQSAVYINLNVKDADGSHHAWTVSARTLHRAIQAWTRGENHLPQHDDD